MTDHTEPQGLVELGVPTSEAAGVAALAEEGTCPRLAEIDVKIQGPRTRILLRVQRFY